MYLQLAFTEQRAEGGRAAGGSENRRRAGDARAQEMAGGAQNVLYDEFRTRRATRMSVGARAKCEGELQVTELARKNALPDSEQVVETGVIVGKMERDGKARW